LIILFSDTYFMNVQSNLERNTVSFGSQRRSRRELAVLITAAIAGSIGLAWLSISVTKPKPRSLSERLRGNIASTEPVAMFIPAVLNRLATELPDLNQLTTHEGACTWLQQHGLEKLWYAVIYKVTESDGRVSIMPVYARPFETASRMPEFRAVIATIRGHPPRNGLVDYAGATVSQMPEELAVGEPSTAMGELVSQWQEAEERIALNPQSIAAPAEIPVDSVTVKNSHAAPGDPSDDSSKAQRP
jgi:hypothetical protein